MVDELGDFVRAALVVPATAARRDPPAAVRRRRMVVVPVLLLGAVVTGWALRIPAGDPTFYLATAVLALVWVGGAFAAGPQHAGHARTRSGALARPWVQATVLGLGLVLVFLVGGLLIDRVPWLRDPVVDLLEHADVGAWPVVLLITVVNGISEELFFRGALYPALPARWAVAGSTVAYVLVGLGSGIWLLQVAAAFLGVVTALQRRVTGGVLAPVLTHLVFTTGLFFLLPPVLEL